MARRPLKVFQASFGFSDSVVAAPSQKAALEAWGARQNLFAEGLARITDDAAAAKAALDHPGQPLTRPVGSKDAFALGARGAPKIPTGPSRSRRKAGAGGKTAPPSEPPPDRSALDAAEAALEAIEAERRSVEADFEAREKALKAERRAAEAKVDERLAAQRETIEAAKRAFRETGGKG
jgi:hypothetical protein